MNSKKKKDKENHNYSVQELKELLESDRYLKPCFILGYIQIIEKPGVNPIWIDFTLKDHIRQYIRDRVDALLAGNGDEQMEREIKRWDELKKIDVMLEDVAAKRDFEAGEPNIADLEAEETGLARETDPREMHARLTTMARIMQGKRKK